MNERKWPMQIPTYLTVIVAIDALLKRQFVTIDGRDVTTTTLTARLTPEMTLENFGTQYGIRPTMTGSWLRPSLSSLVGLFACQGNFTQFGLAFTIARQIYQL